MWGGTQGATRAVDGSSRIRVALVDDHTVVMEAMRMSLETRGLDVVEVPPHDEGADLLVASVLAARADVVLLDLQLGAAGDGSQLIPPLVRGGQRVVVLTASRDPVRWGGCLASGAAGVVNKTASLQAIVEAVNRTAGGLPVLSPQRRQELVQLWRTHSSASQDVRKRLSSLTPRETAVLTALLRGKRVREVAQEALVSEATVRTQVKSILAKLGVNSQLAAVALAREAGWDRRRRQA